MNIINFCVYRDVDGEEEEEIELEIEARVSGGSPGKIYGPPENCYPPEPPEVEIHRVLLNGNIWDDELTDDERIAIEQDFIDNYDDCPDSGTDRYREEKWEREHGYDVYPLE